MTDRRGDTPTALPQISGAVRRLAAILSAGTMLVVAMPALRAQEREETSSGVDMSGLRPSSDLELGDLRLNRMQPVPPPLTVSRDQTPQEPSRGDGLTVAAPEDAGDVPAEEADGEAAPRRPKLDLFDGPPAKAARQNDPVAPAVPAGEATSGRAPDPGADASRTDRLRTAAVPAPKAPSLPPALTRAARIGAVDGRLNLRASPPGRLFPASPNDAFAPVGMRLGSFTVYSTSDQSVGVSNNLERTPDGTSGVFAESTQFARLVSDWSRHQAEMNALTSYRRNFSGDQRADPEVKLDGKLRLDVDHLTNATLKGAFGYRREDAADLDAVEGSSDRPAIVDYATTADIERQFGRAFARATASAAREMTGRRRGSLSTLDEDFDTYTGAFRTGYRLSPAFAPFVEASVGRRVFDERRDALDRRRDSVIQSLRSGVALDFGEKLSGEIAAGFARNVPDEETFETTRSPTIDARIAWSPRRGTNVALTAATTFDPDNAGAAAATLYETGIAVRHRAAARLDLDAALTAGYRDSQLAADQERTWGASAGFTYWINRTLAVIGLASHDTVDRLHGPGDYDVDTVKLGIRVQN